ncbi:MAG: hypothetical protein MJ237_09745 [bacterium]|nr:hypothetical protein [bacterium]
MKNKFKTFICGLLIVLYGAVTTVLYVGAVRLFLFALDASGIVTIGYFLGSVVLAVAAVILTYRAKKE